MSSPITLAAEPDSDGDDWERLTIRPPGQPNTRTAWLSIGREHVLDRREIQ